MAASVSTAAPTGLTSAQAAARLAVQGPNVLPAVRPPAAWRRLAAQMFHFFAVMLWIAGGLAFVARLPALGLAIFVVILVNGVFAFVQEHRAEHAAARLRDLMPRRVTVVRDGLPAQLDASELVAGDLVLLGSGDRISADMRVLGAHGLRLDTSTLTGESVPTAAGPGDPLMAGTFVVEGEGSALVEATGERTRLAGIARLTRAGRRAPGPLAAELARVVRIVAAIAVGVGTGFFALALALGTPVDDGFVFAIGVTVALVPEGLLPTVTLSLAIGAQRMAGRRALVRRLESVETLGSTTFICTDKTGTLTRNEMAVVAIWTPVGEASVEGRGYEPRGEVRAPRDLMPALRDLAVCAVRCSNGRAVERDGRWIAHGDPMEAALDAFARRVGADVPAHSAVEPELRRFAFDPRRRRMSVVARDRVLVKGAPDAVLPRCAPVPGAEEALAGLTSRGLRVLAVAARPLTAGDEVPGDPAAAERDLELLGIVGLEDPPRAEAAAAIADVRGAGVRVAMVTGDHPRTAHAIAVEVGLCGPADDVVLGDELPEGEQDLEALVDRDGLVCARVSPEQKLRIARALRRRGHVLAMTGDGVNDGPALQEADIGVAMGRSGTDVAREAADLVLLDDDFATIIAAIEQGRATYSNIRRFLTYHLTDNVAELTPFVVWALSAGNVPLALGVLQVLSLDIGTDLMPAAALGAEPPARGARRGPPPKGHLLDRAVLRRAFGVLGPTEAIVEMAAFAATFVAAGWRPGDGFPGDDLLLSASGAAFSAVILGQAANAFACRSATRPPWRLTRGRNTLLIGAVATMPALLAASLFVEPIADLLGQAPPTLVGFAVALLAVPAVLLVDALDKRRRGRGR